MPEILDDDIIQKSGKAKANPEAFPKKHGAALLLLSAIYVVLVSVDSPPEGPVWFVFLVLFVSIFFSLFGVIVEGLQLLVPRFRKRRYPRGLTSVFFYRVIRMASWTVGLILLLITAVELLTRLKEYL